MPEIHGSVNGIDVHALPGQPVRCFAFINRTPAESIQVVAYEARLQSALELASSNGVEVEVSYQDNGAEKGLTRVRLLDR